METAHPAFWQTLTEFNLPSQPDIDRLAPDQVAAAINQLNLSPADLERLKTAVARAVLNAVEHGNRYRADVPLSIRLRISINAVAVQIIDPENTPVPNLETPGLSAKITQQQSPRSWGFFLIERMVDDVKFDHDNTHHRIELFLYLE